LSQIYIMRGLPGAGKTTWVRLNHPDARVCSADDFFLDNEGIYRFDGALISEAHAHCLRNFVELLTSLEREKEQDSPEVLVVDNTAIKAWEISPYYHLAKAYGHDVKIIQLMCDPETAYSRNVHGVSMDLVETMAVNLTSEDLPAFWALETVEGTNV